MHTLGLPKQFPLPQNMKNSSIATWVTWMRDESNDLIATIDEEIARRRDPDDPFDSTASGIFPPLQQEDEVQQQYATPSVQHDGIKVDESRNHNPQEREVLEGRLIDVQSPIPRQNHDQITTHEVNVELPPNYKYNSELSKSTWSTCR